jgi:hypothetical protein
MGQDFRRFLRAIFGGWKGAMCGGFGLLFTISGLLLPSAWATHVFVGIGVCGLMYAAFRAWLEKDKAHAEALERIKPRLAIRSAVEVDEQYWYYRVRVENLADQTCRFGVYLTAIDPPVNGLTLPLPLQITNEPGTAEAILPAKGDRPVDVFLFVSASRHIQITGAHHAPAIKPSSHRLTLLAYCDQGASVQRIFVITPTEKGIEFGPA